MLRAIFLGLMDHARDRLRAHTVERVRKAYWVATFPVHTPNPTPRLWKACGRLALRGLIHRRPEALDWFIHQREAVLESKRFMAGIRDLDVGGVTEAARLRDEHLRAQGVPRSTPVPVIVYRRRPAKGLH